MDKNFEKGIKVPEIKKVQEEDKISKEIGDMFLRLQKEGKKIEMDKALGRKDGEITKTNPNPDLLGGN